MYTQTHTI